MRRLMVTTTLSALLLTPGGVAAAQEAEEVAAVGSFAPTGSLTQGRTGHSATLLPDGRVLITGGEGLDPDDLATAEVWDPATAAFGPADELVEPRPEPVFGAEIERSGHTGTLLSDGRGLIIGGGTDGKLLAEAELIDSRSDAIVPGGTLTDPRTGHTATFLRDGRVLVVGGTGPDGPLASAELWTSSTKPAKCLGKRPTLLAQPGVELFGSRGNDVIAGTVGNDLIAGGGGNDRICGGGGDDTIDGGGGNDTIDGGPGSDTVTGAAGNDRLTGAGGDDTLNGGKGKDVCIGGKGTDWLPGCNDKRKTRGIRNIRRNTTLRGPHIGPLVITANNVRLDCAGHEITGRGKRDASVPAGIQIVSRRGVTVTNCHVKNFTVGFQAHSSTRISLRDNRANGNGWAGFGLADLKKSVVRGNAANRNDSFGFLVNGRNNGTRFTNNRAHDNDANGFLLHMTSGNRLNANRASGSLQTFTLSEASKNTLADNTAEDSTEGFSLQNADDNVLDGNSSVGGYFGLNGSDGNTYTDNHASDVPGAGFNLFFGSRGNTFVGNTSEDNAVGFLDSSFGARTAGTQNTYTDNTCLGNDSTSSPPGIC